MYRWFDPMLLENAYQRFEIRTISSSCYVDRYTVTNGVEDVE